MTRVDSKSDSFDERIFDAAISGRLQASAAARGPMVTQYGVR